MPTTLDLDLSIQQLVKKAERTKKELADIQQGYEDLQETATEAMGGAAKASDAVAKSNKKTIKSFDTQGKTIQQLNARIARLSKAQKKVNDPKLIKKYNQEIAITRNAIGKIKNVSQNSFNAVSRAATSSQVVFSRLKTTIAETFAPLIAVGSIGAGVAQIVTLTAEYEQVAADLSSITGAQGETLEFLKQQAVEVGVETTVGATQALEAYKLIASAKPELLSNAEGLAEITREAVTLTEAMGGDLPTAATNLTDIMNQFNAPASEARRFVNALAAGSKEGSADIGQLAASILVAGTEAKSSNIALEEMVGVTETLAEKGKKGAESGTAMRNVFSKLSATELLPKEALDRLSEAGVDIDRLSDTTLSFTDRLRALRPIQNDANALTAVFGLENKSTAQILLNNIGRIDELTEAVTGTNIAYQQAETRTQTVSALWQKLLNRIQALIQGGTGRLSESLKNLIRFLDATIDTGLRVVSWVDRNARLLKVLVLGYAVYITTVKAANGAQKAYIITTKTLSTVIGVLTGRIKLATLAQKAMHTAFKANPIGVVVTLVTSLAAAYVIYSDRVDKAKSITRDVNKEFAEQSGKLNKLFSDLVKAKQGYGDQKEAIAALKKEYPQHLKSLDLEQISIAELTRLQKKLNEEILRTVVARKKNEALESVFSEIVEAELRIQELANGDNITTGEGLTKIVVGLNADKNREAVIAAYERDIAKLKQQADEVANIFDGAFGSSQRKRTANRSRGIGGRRQAENTDTENAEERAARLARIAEARAKQREEEQKKEEARRLKEQRAAEREAARKEREAAEALQRERDLAQARLDALAEGQAKELALEDARFTDLVARLESFGLETEQAVFQHELNKFEIKSRFLDEAANLEGLEGEERIKFLFEQTKAEIDAIENALKAANGGTLTEQQIKQINLLRKNASDLYLKQLKEFQTEEQKRLEEQEVALLELRRKEFSSQKDFEEFKEKEILKIRLKFAEEQLKLIEKTKGAESSAALALRKTINEVKGELAGLTSENTAKGLNLYSLFGLDPNDPQSQAIVEGINTATSSIIDSLSAGIAKRQEAAEAAVNEADANISAIDQKIESAEEALRAEQELAKQGIANRAQDRLEEIAALKEEKAQEEKVRKQALEDRKKAQRNQEILNTVLQGSNLITAATDIFKATSAIPFAGVPIAIGLVSLMLGSFAAAKAKTFKAINQQRARYGATGVIKGDRHTDPSGGVNTPFNGIVAEDGERFGILSREATNTFGPAYAALTNAANRNDGPAFRSIAAQMAATHAAVDGKIPVRNSRRLAKLNNGSAGNTDSQALLENNKLLKAMLANAKKKKVKYLPGKKIITQDTHTRVIREK